jgi:Bacterial Ig-like domain (group 3)
MGAFHRNLVVLVLSAALAVLGLAAPRAAADTAPGIIPASASTTTPPQPGDVLTESPAATWTTPPSSTSIQWLDCNSTGLSCNPISGATGPEGSTYTVAPSDVGFTIEVQDTATYLTPPTSVPLSSGPTLTVVPANTQPPAISGTPDVGQTLTDTGGTWNPPQSTITYQWIHCKNGSCSSILNTNRPTYTVAVGDLGDTIEVQETATYNGSAQSAPAVSAPVAVTVPSTTVVPANTSPALSAPVAVTVPSTTSLLALPANPITNQTTSLVATVTSTVAVAFPEGSVSFQDAGTPIAGCSAVPVATLNQSVQVTCQTEFSASSSPEALTAVFVPKGNSGATASTSPTLNLATGRDSTTTALDVSNPVVIVGRTATYTATVTPANAGVFEPSGSVLFRDGGKPISACSAQPLQVSQGFDSAQCTVHYAKVGSHSISAIYSGDGGFDGSASSSQAVSVKRLPLHILGTIVAKMDWAFRYAPKYTQILSLLLNKPAVGTAILLECRGHGCPFAQHSVRVRQVMACKSAGKHCVTTRPAKLQLASKFGRRRLHVGTVVTIELARRNWIGKAYVFKIRAGRGPHYHIGCVAPGSTKVGVGC